MYVILFQNQKLQNTLIGLNFEVMYHNKFKPQLTAGCTPQKPGI
jgi:hypothetical protein